MLNSLDILVVSNHDFPGDSADVCCHKGLTFNGETIRVLLMSSLDGELPRVTLDG